MHNIFRKKMTWIIGGIVVIAVGTSYAAFSQSDDVVQYVTAPARRGTLVTSVGGSGQVASAQQMDVKPNASGRLVALQAREGAVVRVGTLLAQVDARDALRAVRDAQTNLASARVTLQKMEAPADELTMLQAKNSLTQAQESKKTAEQNIIAGYEDGYNRVAAAFLDMPTVMVGLNDILIATTMAGSAGQWNIDYYLNQLQNYDAQARVLRDGTYEKYQTAKQAHEAAFALYKTTPRTATPDELKTVIATSYDASRSVADAVKAAHNFVQRYRDALTSQSLKPHTTSDAHLTQLNSFTNTMNTQVAALLSVSESLRVDMLALQNAERTIAEKTESLAKTERGTEALDLESQRLAVKQRENALRDAQEKLADYSVRVPFDGVVAKTAVKRGEQVSSGTTIATLITKQKIIEISLNEVDAARVRAGMKTTVTFDAIPDFFATGVVANIDTLGTVSQGVVTYNVQLTLDTQDERVKSGMSASATIIQDAKQDVVMIPIAALKRQGEQSYVEILDGDPDTGTPRRMSVQVGASNDEMTEIIFGVSEGDRVVVRTITSAGSATTPAAQQRSLFPTGGGGAARGLGGGAGGASARGR